ncbi:zinc finger protein 282-like isoform X2 [Bufo gargarizans]|uniref:zinc finger protein 282-like isoform X2 n=1 Tax=Bufo gargarizans TaxID=30331 RepID=UPI001CF30931|nr:zinc finger protein 282-like isoform X2 [Bufo gargarizans]
MAEEIRHPGTVTFNDVAVYFSLRDWELLADWQKKLYRNVMKEIHGALTALGYEIANPGILVRIQQSEEPYYGSHDVSEDTWRPQSQKLEENMADCAQPVPALPAVKPDILLQVKLENVKNEQSCQKSAPQLAGGQEEESNSAVFNPELALWIKQEEGAASGEPSSSLKEDIALPVVEASTPLPDTRRTPSPQLSTRKPPKPPCDKGTVHKRTGLKLKDKILVLCAYENNESVGSIAAQFGVSRAQVVQIIKRREELLDALQNNVSGDRIRRRRRTTNDQLNSAVWEWLLSIRDTDVTLSGRIIREKALQIARDMGIQDFKASNGWLDSFKKAHNIHRSSLPFSMAGMEDWLSSMGAMDDR